MVGWKNSSNRAKRASIRLRCIEPLQELRNQNYPVELFQAHHLKDYRVVVFNKIYDEPHQELTRQLKISGAKVVLDLCDNLFYNPDNDPKIKKRGQQILRMLEFTDMVTVPSAELQKHLPVPSRIVRDGVRPLGPLEKLPQTILRRFKQHKCNLVWFGNWGVPGRNGGMHDLLPLKEQLIELSKRYDIGLTIISNNRPLFDEKFSHWDMPIYYKKWRSAARLRRNLSRFDVALLPMIVDPLTIYKSNNRLTLSLYFNLAVLADPIPAYEELAPYCMLGDWDKGLENIISSRHIPNVAAGKEFVENNYMTAHAAQDWQDLFDELSRS